MKLWRDKMSTIYVTNAFVTEAYDIAKILESYAEYNVPGTSTIIFYPIALDIVKLDTVADFMKHFKKREDQSIGEKKDYE